MMKAKRTSEVEVNVEELQQQVVEQGRRQQREEFGEWLDGKVTAMKENRIKWNDFFYAMLQKIIEGDILGEGMKGALRNCMKRDAEWEAERLKKCSGEPKTIMLKIKPFLMKDLGIDSRVISGTVKRETQKAWLIEGYAYMVENQSWCARCGRELTEPASQITGMGAICAEKAGVPYDKENVLKASKKERQLIRAIFVTKLQAQKFERWIPKSQAEVLKP
jgi:hypothetical protein